MMHTNIHWTLRDEAVRRFGDENGIMQDERGLGVASEAGGEFIRSGHLCMEYNKSHWTFAFLSLDGCVCSILDVLTYS